jgi:hypothetical protein
MNGGGRSSGRRPSRPGDAVRGARHAEGDEALESRIGAALRQDAARVGPEAEGRAVAAFRAARDAGAHRARTRRRDDWRPSRSRLARLMARTSLSAFLASIAMGGIAVAAIAAAGSPADGGRTAVRPSAHPPTDGGTTHTSGRPPAGPSAVRAPRQTDDPVVTGSAPAHIPAPDPARPRRPAKAEDKDIAAHCRAYEQVEDRGRALDSTAWQRLVSAAGGAEKVPAYCAEQPTTQHDTDPAADGRNGGKK